MRVLVASTGNDGHFGPLVPFARACLAGGHQVLVAAPESYARSVSDAGLVHAPFADAPADLIGPVMSRLPSMSFADADATVIREVFARIDAHAALPAITETIDRWRPDVVLREPAELGSLAAAEVAGVPHAQVAIGMQEMLRTLLDLTVEPLAALAESVGLPQEQLSAAWRREPTFTTVPEQLDRAGDPGYREDLTLLRATSWEPSAEAAGEPLPAWGDPSQPLLYVTFGSVAGSLPPFAGVFKEAIDGLADLPVRVLMTVGRRLDVASLDPLPANVMVVPWWPQAQVLGHASAILHHGGFGTTMGALHAGIPQAVAPLFTGDQAVNGRHVASAGAGLTVEPGRDVVTRALAVLPDILEDPVYLTGAREAARQAQALPAMATAVAHLEAMVRAAPLPGRSARTYSASRGLRALTSDFGG